MAESEKVVTQVYDEGFRLEEVPDIPYQFDLNGRYATVTFTEEVIKRKPLACGSCFFAKNCDSARENAYQRMDRIGAGVAEEFFGEPAYKADALGSVIETWHGTEQVIDAFEAAGQDGSCDGGEEQIREITYENPAYSISKPWPVAAIKRFVMRRSGEQFVKTKRTIYTCANPYAEAAKENWVNFFSEY